MPLAAITPEGTKMQDQTLIRRGIEESLDDNERMTLDLLLDHKMLFTQEFLRSRELAFSGTKSELRNRLVNYLIQGNLVVDDLLGLLNQIEGWGDQHIYLYTAPNKILEMWKSENSARALLRKQNLEELFNRPRPIVLPDGIELATVEWRQERVRFIWIERREWEQRIEEQDREEGDIIWKAYQRKTARGITTFDIDLISGDAMLLIQKLPSGRGYSQTRDHFKQELEPLMDLELFQTVRISKAIKLIEQSGEVRNRELDFRTAKGSQAKFRTAKSDIGTHDDTDLDRAGKALGASIAGRFAEYYWLTENTDLTQEVHIKLYATDHRINIWGEQTEGDVRYVVSRIRKHCQRASGNK
jgi:hypothetical protein